MWNSTTNNAPYSPQQNGVVELPIVHTKMCKKYDFYISVKT